MAVSIDTGRSDSEPFGLRTRVNRRNTTVLVELEGELDIAAEGRVRTAVRAALRRCPQYLVLDLSRLTFMDAAGVRAAVQARQQAAAQHVPLMIIPGPEAVQRVFDIWRAPE